MSAAITHGDDLGRGRQRYERIITRRLRWADAGAWLRAGGVQVVWLVVVVAGAAIPLTEALVDWAWLSPVLGFVVVVASGIERIFGRTTRAAAALDELRRGLAREHRTMLAGSGPYAGADDPFAVYASRTEEAIHEYDVEMVAHNREVVARLS